MWLEPAAVRRLCAAAGARRPGCIIAAPGGSAPRVSPWSWRGLSRVCRLYRGLVKLIGRQQECARIDRLLADARNGRSGTLLLRGEPGIGKSALLAYARGRAGEMETLSAVGVEAEADLPFA